MCPRQLPTEALMTLHIQNHHSFTSPLKEAAETAPANPREPFIAPKEEVELNELAEMVTTNPPEPLGVGPRDVLFVGVDAIEETPQPNQMEPLPRTEKVMRVQKFEVNQSAATPIANQPESLDAQPSDDLFVAEDPIERTPSLKKPLSIRIRKLNEVKRTKETAFANAQRPLGNRSNKVVVVETDRIKGPSVGNTKSSRLRKIVRIRRTKGKSAAKLKTRLRKVVRVNEVKENRTDVKKCSDTGSVPPYQCVLCSCQSETKELMMLHFKDYHSAQSVTEDAEWANLNERLDTQQKKEVPAEEDKIQELEELQSTRPEKTIGLNGIEETSPLSPKRLGAGLVPSYQCVLCSCQLPNEELLMRHFELDHSLTSLLNQIEETASTSAEKRTEGKAVVSPVVQIIEMASASPDERTEEIERESADGRIREMAPGSPKERTAEVAPADSKHGIGETVPASSGEQTEVWSSGSEEVIEEMESANLHKRTEETGSQCPDMEKVSRKESKEVPELKLPIEEKASTIPQQQLYSSLNQVVKMELPSDIEHTKYLLCDRLFLNKFTSSTPVHTSQSQSGVIEKVRHGYCCDICGCSYSELDYLFAHREVIHPELADVRFDWNQFQNRAELCQKCWQYFREGASYMDHKCAKVDAEAIFKMCQAMSKSLEFECNVCSLRFKWKPLYELHEMIEHEDVSIRQNSVLPEEDDCFCVNCIEDYDSDDQIPADPVPILAYPSINLQAKLDKKRPSLELSSNGHLEENPLRESDSDHDAIQCRYCQMKFKGVKSTLEHTKLVHGKNEDEEYYSPDCGKCLVGSNLEVMMRKTCHEHSSNAERLQRFCDLSRVQLAETVQYQCQTCIRTFANMSEYAMHYVCHMECTLQVENEHPSRIKEESVRSPMASTAIIQQGEDLPTTELALNSVEDSCGIRRARGKDLGRGVFECPFCEEMFIGKKSILEHASQEHGQNILNPYYCAPCGKYFQGKTLLQNHKKIYHPSNLNEEEFQQICRASRVQRAGKVRYACQMCPRVFANINKYKMHYSWHKAERNFICEHCGYLAITRNSILLHIYYVHNSLIPRKAQRLCTECGSTCLSKNLARHMKTKHSGNPVTPMSPTFQCATCAIKFQSKMQLQVHLDAHACLKKFVCDVCGEQYLLKKDLTSHRRLEHYIYDRPHQCSFCLARFKNQQSLTEHQMLHMHTAGPRKYTFCEEEFHFKWDLVEHMKSHTEVRNFPCQDCDGECTSVSNLCSHVSQAHVNML